MKVRVSWSLKTFKFGGVRRLEIEPKRVRLEMADGQVTELPFDHAYGLATVVVFEDGRIYEPHT
jgi:hypothetical protein